MLTISRVLLIAGLSVLLLVVAAPAATGPQSSESDAGVSRAPEEIRYHQTFGTPELIRGYFLVTEKADRALAAQRFIADREGLFKIQNPYEELAVMKQQTDRMGYEHVRFRQMYQGLRVWGCETIAHFDGDDALYMIGGQTIATPEISVVPMVSEASARGIAEAEAYRIDPPGEEVVATELLIYPDEQGAHLCWLVTVEKLEGGAPCRWRVFVDAESGEIRHRYNDVRQDGPFVGSGSDVFDTTRLLNAYQISGQNYLVDATRPMYVAPVENYQGVIITSFLTTGSKTRDINGDSVFIDHPDYDECVSAHYNMALAYEYFLNRFGWDSWDGVGGTIEGVAHASGVVNNAYYMGNGEMQFGSGDDSIYLAFGGSLDVVTHELGHGVSGSTANLIYQFESGALDESYSDVWAVMADADDWLICEDIRLAPPGFMRSFENPSLGGQPMHMSEWVHLPLDADWGGVHTNSGIPNHACYLVAQQIGRYATEEIWWRTLTTYLTSSSGMMFWATATEQAAIDLYGIGSIEAAAVKAAMDSVGIVTAPLVSVQLIALQAPAGQITDTSFFITAGPFDTVTVDSVTALHGRFGVAGPFPATLTASDTLVVGVSYDAGGSGTCDLGSFEDTLLVSSSMANPTIPVSVQVMLADAVLDTFWQPITWGTGSVSLNGTNSTRILSLHLTDDDNPPGPNLVYTGSLAIGLVDGDDTTVHLDCYSDQTILPASNGFTEGKNSYGEYGTYWKSFDFLGHEGGRVSGRASAFIWNGGQDGVIYHYWLTNVCDTPLQAVISFFADIDISAYGDQMGLLSDRGLGYVAYGNSCLGVAALGETPRSIRAVHNPTYVWPNRSLEWGQFYQEMMAEGNTDGLTADDWSVLVTFDTATLAPNDSVLYRIALLHSAEGPSGFGALLDELAAEHYTDSAALKLSEDSVILYAPLIGPLTEEQVVVSYVNDYVANQGPMPWSVAWSQPWLQVTPASGVTTDTMHLTVDPAGLAPGIYYDTLVLVCEAAADSPRKVPLQVRVNPGMGVVQVPGDVSTIQTGLDIALEGDTVLVGPGTYQESLRTLKTLVLRSTDGPEATELIPPGAYWRVLEIPRDYSWERPVVIVEISGFTIRGPLEAKDFGVFRLYGNVFRDFTARNTQVVATDWVYFSSHPRTIIDGNVFANVSLDADKPCILTSNATVSNNTFYNVPNGIWLAPGYDDVQNNVFAKIPGTAIYGETESTCNIFWEVDTLYNGSVEGVNDTVANPRFCSTMGSDFRVAENSICRPENNSCSVWLGAVHEVGCTITCELRGDLTHEGTVAVSDLTYLIAYLFRGGAEPLVLEEADVNGDGGIAVSDLTYLIAYLFRGGATPAPCAK